MGSVRETPHDQESRRLETLNHYFEDLKIGDRYLTGGRTVTEADIVTFSGFSGDYHPLHTDEVWASKGPSGLELPRGSARCRSPVAWCPPVHRRRGDLTCVLWDGPRALPQARPDRRHNICGGGDYRP